MTSLNRRQLIGATGVAAVTITAGCLGGDDDDDDDGNGVPDEDEDIDREGTLEERAQEEGTFTIYSVVDEPAMRDVIMPAFEEQYEWAEAELLSQAPPEIASRMRTEYQTDNVDADVALNTQGTMQPLEALGAYRSPGADSELLEAVEELYPEDAYDLPQLPGYTLPIVGIYNTERVDDPPESWAEIADSRFEGRIALDGPDLLNAAGGLFASLRAEWGEDEWESTMEDIADNEPRITESASESARVLATGEVDLIIGLFDDLLDLDEDGEPVEGLFHEPTVAINIPTYLAADSPNPNGGELFAKFLIEEDGQRALAETGRTPAQPDVFQEEFADVLPEGVEVLPVAFNDESYYEDPEMWIDRFEAIFG